MSTIALTKDNFDSIVENNDIIIIDFWAEWCGPCKNFAPVFEQVSEQYPDIIFGKIDTEDQPELAQDFNVRSIPLLLVLKENIAIFSQAGALPASALSDIVDQAKALDMDKVRQDLENQSPES